MFYSEYRYARDFRQLVVLEASWKIW